MPDLTSLVRAGAIVPVDAKVPADERCGIVVANSYQHPALLDRPIVRLAVEDVADGVDAEMDALGFARTGRVGKLGRQKFRTLGFPGWALVHDPKRASFALEVTRELRKAKQRVKSKPGHARDAFSAVADRLARSVPHFLPSFWEEAGRAFLAEDSESFAAQCFEKARQVEREHKLTVDEDVRSAVYVEFALSGAVAAKSLSGYAKELEKRYGAKPAYQRFREVALRRTLGGLPPWLGMGKELRALARAGGLDTASEERSFITEVLDSPSMTLAPGDFWQLYRPALVVLAKTDAKVRARLRHLFPKPVAQAAGFAQAWFGLLEEAGVIEALASRTEEEPEPDAPAKWLHSAAQFSDQDGLVRPYLERFQARLKDAKISVDLARGSRWRTKLSLSLAEHALALGIPLAEPSERASFSFGSFDCDPVEVAAHPTLATFLATAVAEAMGSAQFEAGVSGKPGFTTARRAWLEGQLSNLETLGLDGVAEALKALEKQSTSQLFQEFPDTYERLGRVDLATALARTLRGGLFAELTWPAWEKAAAELGPDHALVGGVFPFPVLYNKVKAIALSGQKRVAEHDFVLGPGGDLSSACWVDGQFLVILRNSEGMRAYWSSDPGKHFEFAHYLFGRGDLYLVVAGKDGGVVTANGTVHAGDKDFQPGEMVSDGESFWRPVWLAQSPKLTEFDAKSGATGRTSWPSFVTPHTEKSDGLSIKQVSLAPLPEGAEASPLGYAGGLCGFVIRSGNQSFELTGVDGRTRRANYPMSALVRFPGDDRPRSVNADPQWHAGGYRHSLSLRDPDGVVVGADGSLAFGVQPPISCWHFFGERDEEGSVALRSATDADARALLGADVKQTSARVATGFPAISARALSEAVAAAAVEGTRLEQELARLLADRAPQAANAAPEGGLSDSEVIEAVSLFTKNTWGRAEFSYEVLAVGRFLAGEAPPQPELSSIPWEAWLANTRALAVLSVLPSTSKTARETVHGILRALRHAGFFRGAAGLRVLEVEVDEGSPLSAKAHGKSVFATFDQSRFALRSTNQYGSKSQHLIERSEDGSFRLPPGVTVVHEHRSTERGDAAYFDRMLELAAANAPPPPLKGDEAVISELTGLTRAESCLLWFGLSKLRSGGNDVLPKELRETIDLKSNDAKVAFETFRGIPPGVWLTVLDAAAPEDPADLFVPGVLPRRLAEAWVQVMGKSASVREDLVVAVERELDPPVKSVLLVGAAQSPSDSPLLQLRPTTVDELFSWQPPSDRFQGSAVQAIAMLIAWGFGALPVGDPYRDGLVALHELVLLRLRDPEFALALPTAHAVGEVGPLPALFEAIGGELKTLPSKDGSLQQRDAGPYFAFFSQSPQYSTLKIAIRPAHFPDLAAEPLLWTLAGPAATPVAAACFLQGAACARLIARIRVSSVPAGGFENNPLLSVPALVERASKALDVSLDAAQLYLQILALSEPTNKNVLSWNNWKPAQLKKAGGELRDRRLLVEGKRERAGRDLFLPGAWQKSTTKALPMESWKLSLYALPCGALLRTLPPRASHELFEAALTRVERGDVPKLEEV